MLSPAAAHRYFWIFALLHALAWTLIPLFSMPGPPLDVTEMIAWGREFQWGYYKHPPLPPWLAELAFSAAGLGGVYLLSQAFIITTFYAAFRLAMRLVDPMRALCAVFLLETIHYYTLAAPEFNHNVALTTFWALTITTWHSALTRPTTRAWVLTGVFLGLGVLSKYSIAFLALSMAAFTLINPTARRSLSTRGPYIAFAVALIITLPHLFWVYRNDFVTIDYAVARSSGGNSALNHLLNPLRFILSQAAAIIPPIIASLPLIGLPWRWKLSPLDARGESPAATQPEPPFHRCFLLWIILGPLAVHLLISAATGGYLRSAWGTPLWTFLPLLVAYSFRPRTTRRATKWTLLVCLFAAILLAFASIGRSTLTARIRGKPLRTDFPGRELAARIDAAWTARYSTPIPVVAGHWWPAVNTSVFSRFRPSFYSALDPELPAFDPRIDRWTSIADINARGGVVVWDAAISAEPSNRLREAFPVMIPIDIGPIEWKGSGKFPPVRIGVAFIPQSDSPAR